jgi:hypothetical protein
VTGIPFMITQAMKAALHQHGFPDDEIAQLTPERAHEILAKPNKREVREFFETTVAQVRAATRHLSDPGVWQMILVHPSTEGVATIYRYALDDPDLVERMTHEAVSAAETHNVYVEARTVRRGLGAKQRGGLNDTVAVWALVTDSDNDKGAGWSPTVPVSLAVETSPGNAHDWFFFERAVDTATGQALGERLRAATNADSDTGNVCQPYRVPGTPNYPGKKKLERGRIVTWTRSLGFDPETLWTPERFEQEFPATNGGGGAPTAETGDETNIPADTMRFIRDGVGAERDRSYVFWNVVIALKRLGWTVDGITNLFEQYPDGIAKKYEGRLRQEVERCYGKIKDKPESPSPQPGPDPASGLGEWNAALDVDPPPPRGWLLGNVFCRTFLSSIIGSGGVGKTALRYAQALSLATGRKLTGEHVFERCRVLIVSLEDDADELRRRIRAARLHYDIPLSELDGWLFLAAPGAKAGKLMVTDQRGRAVPGDLGANLEVTITARKIDLVMLDPFVKSHAVEENLNSAIDGVTQMLTDLATKHNIAVDAPHHVSKGQMAPGEADRGRGASAYIAAARLVYTCLPMSPEEAQQFGIAEADRRDYVRVDSGKVNITKASRAAKWFHLVGVPLDNKTALYPAGDEVQTVEPWEPPKTWADLNDDDRDSMLMTIDAGLSNGNLYSDASRATTRAAWKVVQNLKKEKSEAQCREIIRTWIDNGVLIKTPYTNPKNRNEEHGLKLSEEKRKELDIRVRARATAERRKTLAPLAAVLAAWKAAIGVNERRTLHHVIEMAAERINPNLYAAFLAVAAMDDGKTISNVLLARWLRDHNEVAIDGLMLSGGGVDEAGSPWWTLVPATQKTQDEVLD